MIDSMRGLIYRSCEKKTEGSGGQFEGPGKMPPISGSFYLVSTLSIRSIRVGFSNPYK